MEIIARGAAADAGLSLYFTGKPCKRGHLSPRYVVNGSCSECNAESNTQARKEIKQRLEKGRTEAEAA